MDMKKVTLLGDRVRLRPLREDDLPLRVQWYNDPDVRKTLTVTERFELEKTKAWFAAIGTNDSRVDFVIETPDGTPMGVTSALSRLMVRKPSSLILTKF